MEKLIKSFLAFVGLIIVVNLSSCYYDNLERLNPQVATVCDTSGTISYATIIKPIIDNNCNSCHAGASPSSGISLDTYSTLKSSALTGKLYNSITWANGASPMPKGSSSKMDDCSITKIKKWIDTNYPQ